MGKWAYTQTVRGLTGATNQAAGREYAVWL